MQLVKSVSQKWFPTFRILTITLAGMALGAEVLPEVKAKLIVIPALILTIILVLIEIRNERNRLAKGKDIPTNNST